MDTLKIRLMQDEKHFVEIEVEEELLHEEINILKHLYNQLKVQREKK